MPWIYEGKFEIIMYKKLRRALKDPSSFQKVLHWKPRTEKLQLALHLHLQFFKWPGVPPCLRFLRSFNWSRHKIHKSHHLHECIESQPIWDIMENKGKRFRMSQQSRKNHKSHIGLSISDQKKKITRTKRSEKCYMISENYFELSNLWQEQKNGKQLSRLRNED